MSIYLANHHVSAWSDEHTLLEARKLLNNGAVQQLETEEDQVRATVLAGGRSVRTRFRVLPDGSVLSDCPCPQSQFAGTVCVHVLSAGLALAARTEDTRKERARRIEERREREERTGRSTAPLSGRREAPAGSSPTAQILLRLPPDWEQKLENGSLLVSCRILVEGQRIHPDRIKPGRPLSFSQQDFQLLYILEDLASCRSCPAEVPIRSPEDFSDLLYARIGGCLLQADSQAPLHISDTPALSALQLVCDPNGTNHFLLQHASLPEGHVLLSNPRTAWLLHNDTCHLLDPVLPIDWQEAYRQPVPIPPQNILSFLRHTLPLLEQQFPVENETGITANPRIVPGTPRWVVMIQGDLDALSVCLMAQYENARFLVTGERPSPDDAVPTLDDPTCFLARDHEAETEALHRFQARLGPIRPDTGCVELSGQQAMLSLVTQSLPAFLTEGWTIVDKSPFADFCRNGHWVETEVEILPYAGDVYRLEIRYRDDTGQPVATELVEAALSEGRTLITSGRKPLILDTDALRTLQAALAECTVYRNSIAYISLIHAGFIQSLARQSHRVSLLAPDDWSRHVEQLCQRNELPAMQIAPSLQDQLRGYQKEGIRWLGFLDESGYAGILADEMGLGKTVQALAWLEHRKALATKTAPAIVICPTSLLQNWAREIQRFVPSMTYAIMAGPDRHLLWDNLAQIDIVIASYALLRRDIEKYAKLHFSAAILDEAQHIKNRSTQNALAAKRLRADRRLVLTGTPIENSVTDLWSIMDFLMPGYLGSHNSFRIRFEQPVQSASVNSHKALEHLRGKLSPFMLRRLKSEVAAEMPPKVTRVAATAMNGPQRRLYQRLLSQYYEQITSIVDENGFERSRFSVFSALLRLRQCCCHPALLRNIAGSADIPSAKMELFFELLDEAMDGGHRVLVFSQFVQMLHILREALRQKGIRYAYLDGSTRNRMEQVDTFNNTPDIPVFLVSLKAGGSGLNLTGANVVIHYDPWWNPAVEEQATDRTHRIGQTQTVYSIKLITENSIEQKVIDLQHRKRTIINAAMGSSGGFAQHITWDDIQELLKPDGH